MKYITAIFITAFSLAINAADINVQLSGVPSVGSVIFQVYNSPDAFSDLRDPVQEIVLPAIGEGAYKLTNINSGRIALFVYYDENNNGLIDKNFIGIPREKLAFSNNYRPLGPPNFAQASFDLPPPDSSALQMDMYQLLGNRGLLGVGVGVIGRSSPYTGSTQSVARVIPGITYVGERLQWFGPAVKYGIAGSGKLRLAAAAEYRLGTYEENDADILAGLGDRDSTLMAGLSLQYEMTSGYQLELGFQHDVLDRIGGGQANAGLSRRIPLGPVTLAPQLSLNWLSDKLSNYDFGVPAAAARVDRPAYAPGSTMSPEFGVGAMMQLAENWQLVMDVTVERLDSKVVASPLVEDRHVIKGFLAFSYVF